MGGLLYKDFVSVNRIGKVRVTWSLVALTLLFFVLRIAFPGTKELADFIVTNGQGEIVNMIDVFLLLFYVFQVMFSLSFVSAGKIMGNDDKNKIKGYLAAMPLGKNAYVASKYLFLAIAAYVMLTMDLVWGIVYAAFCREGRILDIASMLNSFLVSIILLALFLAAIELPLNFSLGKENAMRVMVVFWTVIALGVIGYLMFGDLTVIAGWDITVFVKWLEKHPTGVLIFQGFQPVIILILYYLSYRLSCKLYRKKEGGAEQ